MQKYIGMLLLPKDIRPGDFIHYDGKMNAIESFKGEPGEMIFKLEDGRTIKSTYRETPIFRYY